MNTESIETVSEAASYFFIASSCFLPFAHAHPFMSTFSFLLSNINDNNSSALCFLGILVASTGAKVSRECSCVSYFVTVASPCSLKLFSPVFSACYAMIIWSIWLHLKSSVMSVFRCMCPMSRVLPAMLGIILVNFFLSLVGYLPECSMYYYSSAMNYLSCLSLSYFSIWIGSGMSSSEDYI